MHAQFTIRSEDMPTEMHVLLEEYPQDTWPDHPGFREKTRGWLGAHQMFRRLSSTIRSDAESFIDGKKDATDYIVLLIQLIEQ